ncbi:hypothetical protein [Rhizobium leguminosarum]|uniref:hypothetical protein n=1 Tax=Rhizobium leguminosarum TaxID=384 RepID=UPI001F23CBAB|nr:hypothetical protein [Rhizobium leguminosarum]
MRIELVPNDDELAIVLRGDLAAILTFACGKRNPAFLEQKAVLEDLMGDVTVSGAQKRKKPSEGALWYRRDRWLRGQDLNLRPGYEAPATFGRNIQNAPEWARGL